MSPDRPNARLPEQRSVIVQYPAGVSTARGLRIRRELRTVTSGRVAENNVSYALRPRA
jgi:hypothetical protein